MISFFPPFRSRVFEEDDEGFFGTGTVQYENGAWLFADQAVHHLQTKRNFLQIECARCEKAIRFGVLYVKCARCKGMKEW